MIAPLAKCFESIFHSSLHDSFLIFNYPADRDDCEKTVNSRLSTQLALFWSNCYPLNYFFQISFPTIFSDTCRFSFHQLFLS